jgi:hypothetical protein
MLSYLLLYCWLPVSCACNPVKWAKFTYAGKETKLITKLFKNSTVSVSYTTRNTIASLLSQKSNPKKNKFDCSGVYHLTCPGCKMKYVGQTVRSFHTRFSEHLRDFKYATQKSRFAQHLLEKGHSIGSINSIIEVLIRIAYVHSKIRFLSNSE